MTCLRATGTSPSCSRTYKYGHPLRWAGFLVLSSGLWFFWVLFYYKFFIAHYGHFAQAMAETVGSIMGNHAGRGRYLMEENYSRELYLGQNFLLLK